MKRVEERKEICTIHPGQKSLESDCNRRNAADYIDWLNEDRKGLCWCRADLRSISICLEMLRKPTVKTALRKLADVHDLKLSKNNVV